jgi:hypothetical protein
VINVKRGEEILETITADKLGSLDPEGQRLVKAYEESMTYYYNVWTQVYPQLSKELDPITRIKLNDQLKEITLKMCSDWYNITNYLQQIGINLRDKYRSIEYICQQNKFSYTD